MEFMEYDPFMIMAKSLSLMDIVNLRVVCQALLGPGTDAMCDYLINHSESECKASAWVQKLCKEIEKSKFMFRRKNWMKTTHYSIKFLFPNEKKPLILECYPSQIPQHPDTLTDNYVVVHPYIYSLEGSNFTTTPMKNVKELIQMYKDDIDHNKFYRPTFNIEIKLKGYNFYTNSWGAEKRLRKIPPNIKEIIHSWPTTLKLDKPSDFGKLTIPLLKAHLKDAGITGYSKLKKDELVKLCNQHCL